MANNLKSQLKIIGYWHSFFEPHYPDPAWFIDEDWNESERKIIVSYLKSGIQMPYLCLGSSWCRFRCKCNNTGSLELTDGTYVWPEGLAHYIESHQVKLPDEVVKHILSNTKTTFNPDNFEMNDEWWKEQRGWNPSLKSYNDLRDIGILTIVQTDARRKEEQKKFLRTFLKDSPGIAAGITGRQQAILDILAGQEVQVKAHFLRIEEFLLQLDAHGLKGSFRYITKEEHGDFA